MFSNRMLGLTYYVTKQMSPELKRNEIGSFPDQYAFIMQFRNETRFTLAIVHRSGMRTYLPPTSMIGRGPGTMMIRLVNSPRVGINSHVDDQFSAGRTGPDRETDVWKRALEKQGPSGYSIRDAQTSTDSAVVHSISEQDILDNLGSLYVANLDLVIAVMDAAGKQPPPHPFSRLGSIATVHEMTSDSFGLSGAAYALKIVDRRAAFGDRFINFGGRVVHVPAEAEVSLNVDDGVYLTTNVAATGKTIEKRTVTEFYDFADADSELPIFRTYDEAVTFGKPDELHQRELDRLKKENERERAREANELLERKRALTLEEEVFAKERRKHEQRMIERTEQLEQMKAQLAEREHHQRNREHELKTEQTIVKHRLDGASDSRKATLDIIKYVPAIIGGAIAIAAVYAKMSAK